MSTLPTMKSSKQKPSVPSVDDRRLTALLRLRLSKADARALDELMARHPLARRSAVAREALRRGLAAMASEK